MNIVQVFPYSATACHSDASDCKRCIDERSIGKVFTKQRNSLPSTFLLQGELRLNLIMFPTREDAALVNCILRGQWHKDVTDDIIDRCEILGSTFSDNRERFPLPLRSKT